MRSDGGKTTSSFLQSEFAPKDYFCGNDRLNGSFYSFMYILRIKKTAQLSQRSEAQLHM